MPDVVREVHNAGRRVNPGEFAKVFQVRVHLFVTDDGQGEVIVFTSAKTWSLVGSFGGLTCVIDQGRDWKSHKTGAPL